MIFVAFLAAAAQPPDSPKVFMERLYAAYRQSNYSPFTHPDRVFAPRLLAAINEAGVRFKDLNTTQSSLEDIFVGLVGRGK